MFAYKLLALKGGFLRTVNSYNLLGLCKFKIIITVFAFIEWIQSIPFPEMGELKIGSFALDTVVGHLQD